MGKMEAPVLYSVSQLTLDRLAESLYAGSVKLEEIQIQWDPTAGTDEEYNRWRVQQALGTDNSLRDIRRELKARVEKAWVPDVVVWEGW